jgi:hypothetical protein
LKKKKRETKIPSRVKIKESEDLPLTPEKPFDFGGLPDRNLKKNLGC